ncbi:MAG: Dabb family protein [Muribaculum sp.]|nr:Dabb family protein [Muribaculum sp.]
MVKHIVAFKLNGTPQERKEASLKFCEALNRLPEVIDCLQSIETGINENPAEEWDVVLTAVIDRMDNVSTYANHPAHKAASAIVAPLKACRACVDYEI